MLDYLLGLISIFSNISRFTSFISINKGYMLMLFSFFRVWIMWNKTNCYCY